MKALANALTLAVLEAGFTDILTARAFANEFVEGNADLFGTQVVVTPTQVERRPGGPTVVTGTVSEQVEPDADGNLPRAVKHFVPVQGPDGLTDRQRAAVGTVGLCPNCQQPNNGHLPGCARASGEDRKARTKDPLPPVA